MNLMDLLATSGGEDGIRTLGKRLNLGSADTAALVAAVAPALSRGLQKQASGGSLDSLSRALATGGHQRYIDKPELLDSAEAVEDGNGILGHLFGSKDVSRNVAAKAAESTGLDQGLIKQALPLLAGLAMGALSKQSDAGRSVGGLLPGLLGGGADDEFGLDDVLNLARKFF